MKSYSDTRVNPRVLVAAGERSAWFEVKRDHLQLCSDIEAALYGSTDWSIAEVEDFFDATINDKSWKFICNLARVLRDINDPSVCDGWIQFSDHYGIDPTDSALFRTLFKGLYGRPEDYLISVWEKYGILDDFNTYTSRGR